MAEFDQESRTLEPTPRRREQMRAEGRVAYSKDLSSAASLAAAVLVMCSPALSPITRLKSVLSRSVIPVDLAEFSIPAMSALLWMSCLHAAEVLWPLLTAVVTASLGAGFLQSGFRPTLQPLQMKGERLSPAHNWKQFLSVQTLVTTGGAVLKLMVILIVFGLVVLATVRELQAGPVLHFEHLLAEQATTAALRATGVIVLLAAADYLFQRFRFHQQLRMTPEEFKQETKEDYGDPQFRQWRKRRMRELLMEGGVKHLQEATVVVTNPIHLAIALRYEHGRDTAPRVIAKGSKLLARHIRERARELGIPVVERKPLARALYAKVRLGDEVPVQLYQAVAEVIRHILALREGARRAV